LPDDRRAPAVRSRRPELRAAAAAVLAVPVIALVIAQSIARRVGRPAIVVALLLSGTYAASAAWTTPLSASPATASRPVPAADLHAVPTPTQTVRPTDPAAVAFAPPTATPAPTPEPTPAPEAPTVIRFRPRDAWTAVSRFAAVSVRFSQPMDHASTQQAFRITVDGKRLSGSVRWAEGDTVLVVDPDRSLPYGSRVNLSVDSGARSADGAPLEKARSVTFAVQSRPVPAGPTTPTTTRPTPRSAPATTGWRWPLIGPITQRFGETKTQYGFHQGIDIDGQVGDRVRAGRGGRVVLAGTGDACGGLQVHIDHGNGFESWYRHLSRVAVRRGDIVAAGALVGRVGNTGCSLGSHLHFAIRRDGTFVDPLRYLPRR
jgi:murein DD-endopeptidase MepM/ murein hydrolase activator NlpD